MTAAQLEALAARIDNAVDNLDSGSMGVTGTDALSIIAQELRDLSSAPPAVGDAVASADRFEQFVAAGIARSPAPLRELGEYLASVLGEDEFPQADRLLLQLATAPPVAVGDAARIDHLGGLSHLPGESCPICPTAAFELKRSGYPATVTPLVASAPPVGDAEVEYEFEVWQGDAMQAGGSATTVGSVQAEAEHYAMMYGQDGPVEVKYYERRALLAPDKGEKS